MDKNREPLTVFRWRRDADGYDLDGGRIRRRGGKLEEYDPSKVRPPLHRIFASLPSQAGDEENIPSALLEFVTEYGFLGGDRSGAEVDSEDVGYLVRLSRSLSTITHWIKLRDVPNNDIHFDEIPGPRARMVMKANPRTGRMQLFYEPETLYAWMWLRTADDLSTGIDWSGVPCLYCYSAMGRGPGGHKRNARFCCDNHRTNFHRLPSDEQAERTARAHALARNEVSP
jgi:hypothetical protein